MKASSEPSTPARMRPPLFFWAPDPCPPIAVRVTPSRKIVSIASTPRPGAVSSARHLLEIFRSRAWRNWRNTVFSARRYVRCEELRGLPRAKSRPRAPIAQELTPTDGAEKIGANTGGAGRGPWAWLASLRVKGGGDSYPRHIARAQALRSLPRETRNWRSAWVHHSPPARRLHPDRRPPVADPRYRPISYVCRATGNNWILTSGIKPIPAPCRRGLATRHASLLCCACIRQARAAAPVKMPWIKGRCKCFWWKRSLAGHFMRYSSRSLRPLAPTPPIPANSELLHLLLISAHRQQKATDPPHRGSLPPDGCVRRPA